MDFVFNWYCNNLQPSTMKCLKHFHERCSWSSCSKMHSLTNPVILVPRKVYFPTPWPSFPSSTSCSCWLSQWPSQRQSASSKWRQTKTPRLTWKEMKREKNGADLDQPGNEEIYKFLTLHVKFWHHTSSFGMKAPCICFFNLSELIYQNPFL